MDRRLVVGVVQSPKEVANCPHPVARGSYVPLEHAEAGSFNYPGAGFLMDGENPVVARRAAPRLGEHNVEVYVEELGLAPEALAVLLAAGVISTDVLHLSRACRFSILGLNSNDFWQDRAKVFD